MKRLLFMTGIVMLLLSCNSGYRENAVKRDSSYQSIASPGSDTMKNLTSLSKEINPYQPLAVQNPGTGDWDKKMIKTADVTLELKDFNTYNNKFHNGLKLYGAYIAQEEQTQANGIIENMVCIKVPVAQFEELMNSLPGEGVQILQRKITTQDITGDIIDTKARVENRKQLREQYLGLLKQAKNMKDLQQVQGELNTTQDDIELASNRVNYLAHQAAYSTINLRYFQHQDTSRSNDDPGFFTRLKEAFSSGAAIIGNILLFFIAGWPLVIILVVALLLWKRRKQPVVKNT